LSLTYTLAYFLATLELTRDYQAPSLLVHNVINSHIKKFYSTGSSIDFPTALKVLFKTHQTLSCLCCA
jgi:hypothetical protein